MRWNKMEIINEFLSKYYIVFIVLAVLMLFSLIGYFIEKKAYDKKLQKTETLETIKIDEKVVMNENATLNDSIYNKTLITPNNINQNNNNTTNENQGVNIQIQTPTSNENTNNSMTQDTNNNGNDKVELL